MKRENVLLEMEVLFDSWKKSFKLLKCAGPVNLGKGEKPYCNSAIYLSKKYVSGLVESLFGYSINDNMNFWRLGRDPTKDGLDNQDSATAAFSHSFLSCILFVLGLTHSLEADQSIIPTPQACKSPDTNFLHYFSANSRIYEMLMKTFSFL